METDTKETKNKTSAHYSHKRKWGIVVCMAVGAVVVWLAKMYFSKGFFLITLATVLVICIAMILLNYFDNNEDVKNEIFPKLVKLLVRKEYNPKSNRQKPVKLIHAILIILGVILLPMIGGYLSRQACHEAKNETGVSLGDC